MSFGGWALAAIALGHMNKSPTQRELKNDLASAKENDKLRPVKEGNAFWEWLSDSRFRTRPYDQHNCSNLQGLRYNIQ